jgi:hypothetical protein
MIRFSEYENFFIDLATDFKPISHTPENPKFAMMDIDDIISSKRTEMDFSTPCMILENFEGDFQYKHNQLKEEAMGAFLILKNVDRNNPSEKRSVMDQTKEIGTKIICRMQQQRETVFSGNTAVAPVLKYFQLNEVKYQKISNIMGGCHGWRFEFNLGNEYIMPYDANDWYSENI